MPAPTKTILLCCTLVAVACVTVFPAEVARSGVASAVGQPEDVFPIDVSWLSPLFLDVRLNNSAPMRFILDSASTWSMIRKKEANGLGLKITRSTALNGGGGEFRLDFARADLQVG